MNERKNKGALPQKALQIPAVFLLKINPLISPGSESSSVTLNTLTRCN